MPGEETAYQSAAELRQAIETFIRAYRSVAKPFIWRKREVKGPQLRGTIVNFMQLNTSSSQKFQN